MKTTSKTKEYMEDSERRIPNLDEHNEAISLFFNIRIRMTKKTILEFRTSDYGGELSNETVSIKLGKTIL